MDVMIEHNDGTVTWIRRKQPRLRTGTDGVASPNACPMGFDPVRYCDVALRKPAMGDSRFYVCQRCGHRGKRDTSSSGAGERGGAGR